MKKETYLNDYWISRSLQNKICIQQNNHDDPHTPRKMLRF